MANSSKRNSKILYNPQSLLKNIKTIKGLKNQKIKKLKSKRKQSNDPKILESNDRLNPDSKRLAKNENAMIKYHQYLTRLKSSKPKSKKRSKNSRNTVLIGNAFERHTISGVPKHVQV